MGAWSHVLITRANEIQRRSFPTIFECQTRSLDASVVVVVWERVVSSSSSSSEPPPLKDLPPFGRSKNLSILWVFEPVFILSPPPSFSPFDRTLDQTVDPSWCFSRGSLLDRARDATGAWCRTRWGRWK